MSTSNVLYSEKVSPALSSLLHNPVEAPLRQKPYMVGMISESKLAVVRASLSRFVTWQHSDFIGADNAGLDALLLRRGGPREGAKKCWNGF